MSTPPSSSGGSRNGGNSRSSGAGRSTSGNRASAMRPTLPTGTRLSSAPPPEPEPETPPEAALSTPSSMPAAALSTPSSTPEAAPTMPAPESAPAGPAAPTVPPAPRAERPAGAGPLGPRPAGVGSPSASNRPAPLPLPRPGSPFATVGVRPLTPRPSDTQRPAAPSTGAPRPAGAPTAARPGMPYPGPARTGMPPRPGMAPGAPRPGMPAGAPGPRQGAPFTPGPRPNTPFAAGDRANAPFQPGARTSAPFAPGARTNAPGARTNAPGARPGGSPFPARPGPSGPSRSSHGGHGGRSFGGRGGSRSSSRSSGPRASAAPVQHAPVQLPVQMTVKELADLMGDSAVNVIKELMTKHGIMANINQPLDRGTAESLVKGLGYEVAETATPDEAAAAPPTGEPGGPPAQPAAAGETRPPVIVVMGHVDHGKTTLLDAIRQSNVAGGEAGGITQHIGAYQVDHNGDRLTFLDTPGHEAFTAMRARGAQVTDVAVIVVAADDGVQPQTLEAINHAKAAKVPLVIAFNKIDAAGANIDRVKQQLADNDVLVEDWGGDVPSEAVSARQKTGIDGLLDMVLLVAQLQDLKADPNHAAQGTIIEAKLDRQVGPVATALVQNGTLKLGDNVVAGTVYGRVRTMLNDRGKPVRRADPATPVSLIGLSGLPQAGDAFTVVADERTARTSAEETAARRQAAGGQAVSTVGRISLESREEAAGTETKEFNLVLKADVQGTMEAIRQSVAGLGNNEVAVNVIHSGVGNISESDILLATASKGLVVGFSVKVEPGAKRAADQNSVEIRLYEVIYTLLEDLEKAVSGMLAPVYEERVLGHTEVRQVFKLPRNEVVAGCYVTDGVVTKTAQCRLMRRGAKLYDGKVASLRRFKDAVNEVAQGFECGVGLEDWRDVQIGDTMEFYGQERVR